MIIQRFFIWSRSLLLSSASAFAWSLEKNCLQTRQCWVRVKWERVGEIERGRIIKSASADSVLIQKTRRQRKRECVLVCLWELVYEREKGRETAEIEILMREIGERETELESKRMRKRVSGRARERESERARERESKRGTPQIWKPAKPLNKYGGRQVSRSTGF